ncbi:MAG: hypothetical protein QXV32_10005 [Conexivisphaerales archaeon]
MTFNGIKGLVGVPGQIPWEIIVGYFIVALAVAFVLGKKTGGLGAFTTLDYVFIGIGAAFAVVWEFFIGAFLGGFIPRGISTYISIGFWGGQLLTMMVVAALVRKVGVGMISFVVYSFLADLFHYGFGGEPIYFFYEALTYGLFLDLMIAVTGGNIFAVKSSLKASAQVAATSHDDQATTTVAHTGSSSSKLVALMVIEGAIIGLLFSFPDPLFYDGFFAPFLTGGYVNWQTIFFLLSAFIPGGVIVGGFAGVVANRIARALGQ